MNDSKSFSLGNELIVKDMAEMDRHRFRGGTLVRKAGNELNVYDPMNVLVPKGTVPEIRDIPEEHRDGIVKLYEQMNARRAAAGEPTLTLPTKLVSYKVALTMHDLDRTKPVPTPTLSVYHSGLHLYVANPEYTTADVKIIPGPIAKAIFGTDNVTSSPKQLTRADAIKAMGVAIAGIEAIGTDDPGKEPALKEMIADAAIRAHFGEDVKIEDEPPSNGYALVAMAHFTGNIGVADNVRVGVAKELNILFDPAEEWKLIPMPHEESELIANLSKGSFKPTHYVEFPLAGMVEDMAGRTGISFGEIRVMIEPGAQLQRTSAWVPRGPFDLAGFKTFLEVRDTEPSEEELAAARDNKVGAPTTLGLNA